MPQCWRIAAPRAVADSLICDAKKDVSLVGCQRPDGVSLCQVSRVTRTAATIRPSQSGPRRPATSNVSTRRYSCRPWRLRSTVSARSAGGSTAQIASIPSCRVCWLALTWATRKLPVSLAISKVFLTVHRIGGEHDVAQSQLTDHLLGGGDFV